MEKIVTFSVLQNEKQPLAISADAVLFFGLHGACTVRTAQEACPVGEAAVYVVSPLTLYHVDCPQDCGMLCMHIAPDILRMAGWTSAAAVHCYLPDGTSKDAIAVEVRRRCAALFRTFFQEETVSTLAGQAIDLASLLLQHFPAAAPAQTTGSTELLKRLEDILRRVQTDWKEPLSLSELAAEQFVSESYLSRIFRKHLGMTFTEYLVSIRLEHAAAALRESQASVTEIAYDNGFKSVNSFIEYFRERYGTTPGQYRRTLPPAQPGHTAQPAGDPADWMQTLLQFDEDTPSPARERQSEQRLTVHVDTTRSTGAIRQSWRRLVNIGYAHDGLIGAVQEQLRRAKREIGFTELHFHGIFDDDMHIYQQNEDSSPWYNFTYADLLFDFILSIGLTPFVELGFMPSKLARVQYTVFDRSSIASTYTDAEKWEALVQATAAHWIERYGLETVCTWRFSIMSFNYCQLGEIPVSYEEYLEMYLITRRALKALDPRLRLGGPGAFARLSVSTDALERLFRDLRELDCLPDFLTAQCYPHDNIIQDSEFLYFTTNQRSVPTVLSKDEDFTAHFLRDFRALARQYGMGDREIVLEEWTSTLWQRDLSSDTCYKSAWLVKNALQSYDRADILGYWLLTDFIEEWFVQGGVFHGGYGLFTAGGIPKAGYQAMKLLTQVGDERIASGKNWFVSRTGSTIQIFLFHYRHYDALYRYRYQKLRDPHDAYKVFQDTGDLQLSLELTGLPSGIYRQERRTINRAAGSSYDKWLEMGAPASMRPADLQYLAETSQPSYEIRDVSTAGKLTLDAHLQPHEVQLIVLQKRDC